MTSETGDPSLDATDRRLLALLGENARLPVASLSKTLGLARATIYARMQRLGRLGVIQGYTVRLGSDYDRRLVRAHVMIKVAANRIREVEKRLVATDGVTALHAISGAYDLIAIVAAESTSELNDLIDTIGEIKGVETTTSSILLATRLLR